MSVSTFLASAEGKEASDWLRMGVHLLKQGKAPEASMVGVWIAEDPIWDAESHGDDARHVKIPKICTVFY